METFRVEAVVDGNTFEVSPPWELSGETGNIVQAIGYNAPKSGKGAVAAEQRLSILMQNKNVELEAPQGIEGGRLLCKVYFQGINLADYFKAYKEQDDEPIEELEE
ncbi:MAG: thermonuclease family protein [Chloroflexota bacterium]|nr:MAG: thermonuclease family protein [Chloroflexota bacterium]